MGFMGNCSSYTKIMSYNKPGDQRQIVPAPLVIPKKNHNRPEFTPDNSFLDSNSITASQSHNKSSSETKTTRLKSAAYLELNENKTLSAFKTVIRDNKEELINNLVPFTPIPAPINLSNLDGIYAFCLVESSFETKEDIRDPSSALRVLSPTVWGEENNVNAIYEKRQYLLINPLINHESNHGLFALFVKKLPSRGKIIAGGEILFSNGKIVTWNLKSEGYSKNGKFNQSHPDFEKNLDLLWLPKDNYQSIEAAEKINLRDNFSRSGSYLDKKTCTFDTTPASPCSFL